MERGLLTLEVELSFIDRTARFSPPGPGFSQMQFGIYGYSAKYESNLK